MILSFANLKQIKDQERNFREDIESFGRNGKLSETFGDFFMFLCISKANTKVIKQNADSFLSRFNI